MALKKYPPPKAWNQLGGSIVAVRILRLHRNLGHQCAICIALCHLLTETDCVRVLVMDGDGEDAPVDVPKIAERIE